MIKKHMCIPFLATAQTEDPSTHVITYTWTRIDKSTVFDLNPNPQTQTYDFICDELPSEVVDRYQPELPQEIYMDDTNPMYQFIFEHFYSLPVGTECTVPCLICFPEYHDGSTSVKKAWRFLEASVVPGNFNTVDKKLSFTIKLNGTLDRGTYTITSGVPTFTPAN